MASGQVDVGFDSLVVGRQFTSSGRLKALAVTGSKRSSVLPEVPTMAEAGYPDVDASVWYAIVAPASTPPAVVELLNNNINQILAGQDVRSKLMALGAEPASMSSQDFGKFLNQEVSKWAEVVKTSGAQVD
jgi:tripartite-type tricarboxylate transporter receptor subunit TctC